MGPSTGAVEGQNSERIMPQGFICQGLRRCVQRPLGMGDRPLPINYVPPHMFHHICSSTNVPSKQMSHQDRLTWHQPRSRYPVRRVSAIAWMRAERCLRLPFTRRQRKIKDEGKVFGRATTSTFDLNEGECRFLFFERVERHEIIAGVGQNGLNDRLDLQYKFECRSNTYWITYFKHRILSTGF